MAVRLFVGNLSYATTEADLRTYFGTVAAPSQVVLPVDRETGRPRGFAFVEYLDRTQAEAAIQRFNGQLFSGRPLAVSEARAREDRGPGGPPRPGGPSGPPRPGGFGPRPSAPFGAPRPFDQSGPSPARSRNFGPDAKPQRGRQRERQKEGRRQTARANPDEGDRPLLHPGRRFARGGADRRRRFRHEQAGRRRRRQGHRRRREVMPSAQARLPSSSTRRTMMVRDSRRLEAELDAEEFLDDGSERPRTRATRAIASPRGCRPNPSAATSALHYQEAIDRALIAIGRHRRTSVSIVGGYDEDDEDEESHEMRSRRVSRCGRRASALSASDPPVRLGRTTVTRRPRAGIQPNTTASIFAGRRPLISITSVPASHFVFRSTPVFVVLDPFAGRREARRLTLIRRDDDRRVGLNNRQPRRAASSGRASPLAAATALSPVPPVAGAPSPAPPNPPRPPPTRRLDVHRLRRCRVHLRRGPSLARGTLIGLSLRLAGGVGVQCPHALQNRDG